MSESQFGTRLIESRVFVVVLVFSAISGITLTLTIHLTLILSRNGFSAVDIAPIIYLWSGLMYLIDPVLYFVVLYLTCGGSLLKRVASVLTSLILASLIGYCIGGFVGAFVTTALLDVSNVIYIFSSVILNFLPQYVVGTVLVSFAVLALSDIGSKWTKALTGQGLTRERPGGVTLLVALYVVFAILNLVAIPILAVFSWTITPLVTIILVAFSCLMVAGQLILAVGLYRGRRWAWVITLILSAGGIIVDAFALGEILLLGFFSGLPLIFLIVTSGLFIGLLICIAIVSYLLTVGVRMFFGFVNPATDNQGEVIEGNVEPSR